MHWRAAHEPQRRVNQCLACDTPPVVKMDTLREHLSHEHGCYLASSKFVPYHWYQVLRVANLDFVDPSPMRYTLVLQARDENCMGISRVAYRDFNREKLLREILDLVKTQERKDLDESSAVGNVSEEPVVNTVPTPHEVPSQTVTSPSSFRVELLKVGKALPPTADTVRFCYGPEMVDSGREIEADLQRLSGTFSAYIRTMGDRNRQWVEMDKERKGQNLQIDHLKEECEAVKKESEKAKEEIQALKEAEAVKEKENAKLREDVTALEGELGELRDALEAERRKFTDEYFRV